MIRYTCEKCGKVTVLAERDKQPECCGEPMKQNPLEVCTAPHDAETYRARNPDDACDDGVH